MVFKKLIQLFLILIFPSFVYGKAEIKVKNPNLKSGVEYRKISNGGYSSTQRVLIKRLSRLGINYISHKAVGDSFSQSARKSNENWSKLPILNYEIIKNGKVSEKYINLYDLIRDKYDISKLKQLQLRDFYLDKSFISEIEGALYVPFSYSVKYVEGVAIQGTIDVEGFFRFDLIQESVSDITLLSFADSQPLEVYGRELGLLDNYDIEFLESVSCSTLGDIFDKMSSDSNLLNQLKTLQRPIEESY